MGKRLPKVIKNRGYYMRVWRAERRLNLAEAAAWFGIGHSQWSLLEDGKRNASPTVAAKIAKELGQPIELFLGVEVPR